MGFIVWYGLGVIALGLILFVFVRLAMGIVKKKFFKDKFKTQQKESDKEDDNSQF